MEGTKNGEITETTCSKRDKEREREREREQRGTNRNFIIQEFQEWQQQHHPTN